MALSSRLNDGGTIGVRTIMFAALIALLVATLVVLAWFVGLENEKETNALPLVAICGVVVLITMLTIVTMTFKSLGLENPGHAMGLPEGSIRAVLALSLVVLFAIFAVFTYRGVYLGGPKSTVQGLSHDEATKFISDHPTARQIKVTKEGGTEAYEVEYRVENSTASDDFAKQLLVLLGTLMTAVTSFYLGANTATTAAATGAPRSQTTGSLQPTETGQSPPPAQSPTPAPTAP
jgi:amino acid transporter